MTRPEQEGKNPAREAWMQLLLNEDRVMTDRAGLFLLTSSILMTSYAFTDIDWLAFLIPSIGLFFSLFWFYIEQRSRKNLTFFWEKVLEAEDSSFLHDEDKIFTLIKAEQNRYHPLLRIQARIVLSYVLPLGWIVIWLLLFVFCSRL